MLRRRRHVSPDANAAAGVAILTTTAVGFTLFSFRHDPAPGAHVALACCMPSQPRSGGLRAGQPAGRVAPAPRADIPPAL